VPAADAQPPAHAIFVITDMTEHAVGVALSFGLVAAATCRAVHNNITFNAQILLCPLHRKAVPPGG